MNGIAEHEETRAPDNHIRVCGRCGLRYDWRRSPSSSLKMTYCGSLCEAADLGFTIEAVLHADQSLSHTPPEESLEEAAASAEAAQLLSEAQQAQQGS